MDFSAIALNGFNAVDLLLVASLLLGLWRGWRVGFVAGTVELAGLAAGLLVAFYATPWLAATLARHAGLPEPWASPTAFLVVFLVVQMLLSAIARRLVRPVQAGPAVRHLNRGLGLVPGAANGAINAMVAAVLLTALVIPLTDLLARHGVGRIFGQLGIFVAGDEEKDAIAQDGLRHAEALEGALRECADFGSARRRLDMNADLA